VSDLGSLVEVCSESGIEFGDGSSLNDLFSYLDLMKLRGCGPRLCALLIHKGISSRYDLKAFSSEELFELILQANQELSLIDSLFLPELQLLRNWVS